MGLVNDNILAQMFSSGAWNWFGVRISMISVTLMIVSTSVCIWFRASIDPVLIGMTLTYILQLKDFLTFFLYSAGDIEKKMVQIQRC